MVKKIGICKLCGEANVQLVDSHIVPKSFYPKGEMILMVSAENRTKKRPTGVYDFFVCKTCEKLFDKWDDHAYKVLLENINSIRVLTNPYRMVLENYDYTRLKLFFLSLLWRLDATEESIGRDVNLGDKHRQKLADAILSCDPKSWDEYAIHLVRLHAPGKAYLQSILPAERAQDDLKRKGYIFFMAGYRVYFLCDSRASKSASKTCHINEDGYTEIPLLSFQGTREEQVLLSIARAEHNQNDHRFLGEPKS